MKSILILGASYGSLLATRLAMAGHKVSLVCTAPTAALINLSGTQVRFPVKGREALVHVHSKQLPGTIRAQTPEQVQPEGFDMAILGMQESQYGEDGVRQLMQRIARAAIPCLAVMNMPPQPFLRRIKGLRTELLKACYTNAALWDTFQPGLVSLASPDPQAFRPPGEGKNVLEVGLPTNFKCAPFEHEADTALLRQLAADIEASRFTVDGESIELPVKLKLHDSLFVPLAKWPMLLTGNYRCIGDEAMIPILDAVHGDLALSHEIYDWVGGLCMKLGAQPDDLVPFEKYAQAAASLRKPSSAARSLFGGATDIERVDLLVQRIAAQLGMVHPAINQVVVRVDARLGLNRESRERLVA